MAGDEGDEIIISNGLEVLAMNIFTRADGLIYDIALVQTDAKGNLEVTLTEMFVSSYGEGLGHGGEMGSGKEDEDAEGVS